MCLNEHSFSNQILLETTAFECKCVFSVCYLAIWLELMFLTTSGTREIRSIDVTQITQPADYVMYCKIHPQIEF